jgi:hypothetical protein
MLSYIFGLVWIANIKGHEPPKLKYGIGINIMTWQLKARMKSEWTSIAEQRLDNTVL